MATLGFFHDPGLGSLHGISLRGIAGGGVSPGIDQWNLRLKDLIELLYVTPQTTTVSKTLIRHKFFSHGQRDYFWSCHGVIWLNFLYYFLGTFITVLRSRLISNGLESLDYGRKLHGDFQLVVVVSAIHAVSDIMIFIPPQLRIWRLQLALHEKFALSAVFSFGLM
ncbi:hypothetical protein BDW71DRAFT_210709 [Aspergillus fruticulosus]